MQGWQLLTVRCQTLCAKSWVNIQSVNIVQDAAGGSSNCLSERTASCTREAGCIEVQTRIGHTYHVAGSEQRTRADGACALQALIMHPGLHMQVNRC